VTDHISRAQWAQIEARVRKVDFAFDPAWKCLIDGKPWKRNACDHTADDQDDIIQRVSERVSKNSLV
jgi:hypothetical protein